MNYEVRSDRDGNVIIEFSALEPIKLDMNRAEELGCEIKKHAFKARINRKSRVGKVFADSLTAALVLCVTIFILTIPFFLTNPNHPSLALPLEAGITLLFIFGTVLSVIFENHLPKTSRGIILFSMVASLAVYAWSAWSEGQERQLLAAKLNWIEKCEREHWESARRRIEVPDCTPGVIKNNPIQPVR